MSEPGNIEYDTFAKEYDFWQQHTLDPHSYNGFLNQLPRGIGTALDALGRKAEAAERFNTVVAERDTMRLNSAYRFFLGRALEKLGRSDEARKVYQELLENARETRLSEREMFYDPGRNPQALSLFKQSLALEGLGRKQEAEQARKKALELDPIINLRAFSPPRAGW